MSAPTRTEREHYAKLVGRHITGILWEELDAQALPILLLDGKDRDGNAVTVTVLARSRLVWPGAAVMATRWAMARICGSFQTFASKESGSIGSR